MANILFEGEKSEHEEETGRIVLHDNPSTRTSSSPRSTRRPFRELWMRNGCQLFDPLVKL